MSTAIGSVDPGSIRRVLCIRPRFLGDICLTLPAIDAVRDACPHARIAYLVEPESAPLLQGDPRFASVIEAPRRLDPGAWVRVVRRLRDFAPDLVLDFFCNPRTALWTRLSGARIRVGYAGKAWRSRLYTHRVRPRALSATAFHLASVAALGWPAPSRIPRLVVGDEQRADALRDLEALGARGNGPWVGFHPGARWPTRRWAGERFAELIARFLDANPGGVALLTGGPEDRARIASLATDLPGGRTVVVTGWPLARFVAAQSLCAAFVSGDTGPMHTAVAVGTPTLGLMSRNSPAMFFPYPAAAGHRPYYARVECSPCHRDECADLRCLDRLTVDGAWSLLSSMLAATTRPDRA